ncbi:hypothetical protein CcaverHIS002_0410240 [Cutaneotrichosporon cavernicola]|uniref:MFS general substrate transporter n=1 Tax=Cutaneotrichosporon cavernicola TaxID=279322 RepID=A0AA48L566_9TREE|nr:uncharacterized protein CcaverHIS019_0410140 [Cutaneotrichosporon cavernicola]BEI84420.1 hypothetical protein CcaverHIS002_0410240 [Cutaneotrichosporon cavernicola]BEI92194.1 hypothetical protein CcaverHIS019_0410140 [Cutaneotrichosporon cavernicola]BEI99965.1 hypothetical protein CcaverHIS631_0410080 [Cutaneotrichosporon cavernicola]BEJ07739.1 hypothetical protein CcaverHIS641_0410080 [Cutaneotrichosporon cavernicola]
MESEATTTAYELDRIRRRSSAGAAPAPFGLTAMTPVDNAVEDDDEVLEASIEPAMTRASRRSSRSADSPLAFKSLALTPMPVAPITPPDTPSKGISIPTPDPFAPGLAHSLPPTPGEAPDPFGSDTEHDAGATEETIVALPPVDRGAQAWSFLIAATCIEAVIWGLPYSVGVFHEYWVSTLFGPEATSTLTLASTLQTGLLFFSGALLGPLFAAFPWYERQIQLAGLALSTSGLIASAYATKPWHLLLTMGVMYPCSAATYLPCATNIFEWFVAKRGLATGIMYGGTGAGGTIYPFVVTALLHRFGYRATMLSIAVSYCILVAAGLFFTKRRVPLVRRVGAIKKRVRPKPDWVFVRTRAWCIGTTFMTLSSLGNFIPLLWTPSYARQVGIKTPSPAALVAMMNGVSVIGNLVSGSISDYVQPRYSVFAYSVVAAAACAGLWGFGTSAGALTGFVIVWGLTGQCLCGFWARMISTIARDDPAVPQIAFSAFISLKGIGAFTSGPISTALLKIDGFRGAGGAYGDTNFGVLIIFTAAMTLIGAIPMLAFPTS